MSDTNGKRTDADYEIEAFTKVWLVFEALEGINFEPIKQRRIEKRTGFSRDFVMRSLRTLRLHGLAVQNDRGEWTIGSKAIRVGSRIWKTCGRF